MRATCLSIAATWAIVFTAPAVAVDEPKDLKATADQVRATPAEMRFREIPWVTDLFEGFRLAKAERRPVFLYMITGDPLDDC